MNIQVLKNNINIDITQKTTARSILPADVGGNMDDLADEQILRGVIQLSSTAELASQSGSDTKLCLIPGEGFFRFVTSGTPNGSTIFAALTTGVWEVIEIPITMPSGTFIELSKSELDSLIAGNDLIPGYEYLLTNADIPLYGGTPVLLKAVSTNKVANSAYGFFANPIYDKNLTGFGIWNNISSLSLTATTLMLPGDSITLTDAPGSVGVIVAVNDTQILFTANSSVLWSTGTALSNGAVTATVTSRVIVTYAPASLTIWGGKVWENLTGEVGSTDDNYNLNSTDWDLIPYGFNSSEINFGVESPYALAIDEIEYDYENDLIIYRKESEGGNEVRTSLSCNDILIANPIKAFQWGNPFDFSVTNKGIGSQSIINSINENINFRGDYQTYFMFRNFSQQTNVLFIEGSSQTKFDFNNGLQSDTTFINSTQTQIIYNNYQISRADGITGYNSLVINSDEQNTIAEMNSVKYSFSVQFDGSAGKGLHGTSVVIPYLSVLPGSFMEDLLADGSSLLADDADAYITLGVEVDAPSNGLNSVTGLVTDLDGGITKVTDSTFTKATELRKIVMAVGSLPGNLGDITSGTLYVVVKLGKIN